MRQGQQHRRGRSRNNNNGGGNHNQGHSNNNNRKGQNPLTRSFESNGPDVKIRGTPAHVAEKYVALARDAQSSGDPVLAENYLQHAEHYYRIILAYREQQGGDAGGGMRQRSTGDPSVDGEFSDDEGDDFQGEGGNSQPVMRGQEPQPGGFDSPRFDAPRFDDRPPRDNRDNNGQRHQQNRHNNRDDGGRQQGDRNEPRRFQQDRPDFRGDQSRGDGRSDNRRDHQNRNEGRQDGRPAFDRSDRGGEPDQRPQRFERPDRSEPVERPAPPAAAPVVEQAAPEVRRREPRPAPVPSHEQPEFLRRPVRRPRREVAVEGAGDGSPDDQSGDA